MQGAILVISGPSGCGKSTLVAELFKKIDNFYFSISTTTREIRKGESEGKNYHYITKEEFERDIKNNQFLEYAKVHDNYYGTSLKPVMKALNEGKLVIFDIDVQGHSIVKDKFPDITTSLFITTPSRKTLENRLKKRATDSMKIIKERLKNAEGEMDRIGEYDHFLINDDFNNTFKKFQCIVEITKSKISSKQIKNFITNW